VRPSRAFIRLGAGIGLGLFLCASGGSAANGDRMTGILGADAVRQCVGRFCLSVPASMIRSADTEEMQAVKLEEVSWDPAAKDPWEHEWLRRLQGIEALKARREIPTLAYGEIIEQRMFKPGVLKGVLFCPSAARQRMALGAILNAGASGLWLQILTGEAKKENSAARISEIAAAYRPAAPGAPLPKGAFHLPRGAIVLPFKLDEESHARFLGGPLKLDLSISTETPAEPDDRGLMQRFTGAVASAALSLAGTGVRTIRSRGRTVAGIRGDELVMVGREGEPLQMSFAWRTPGKASSGTYPEITIEMSTLEDGRRDEKLAAWDQILDAIERAP
jgi:type VI secretion system (T6SS) Tli4-like immunity protein